MDDYKEAREKYKPEKIKILFIGESPPRNKQSYFYFEDSKGSAPLFKAIIKAVFNEDYIKKNDKDYRKKKMLLEKFKENGFFLIDACDTPINQYPSKKRKGIIKKNLPNLVKLIKNLELGRDTKIILIQPKRTKAYELLHNELEKSGFCIANKEPIYFPRYHGDPNVVDKIKKSLKTVA